MEAFPALILLTGDTVLASVIPAQLHHAGAESCIPVSDWTQLQHALHPTPPALAILDCRCLPAAAPEELAALRRAHPLMALIGIGEPEQAGDFEALPLSAFLPLPLSMPQLLRHIRRLSGERSLRAGQQALPLPQGAEFLPAEKCIRHEQGETELTDKESALLLCLYHHRHSGLPRQQLLEEVWGYHDSVTTHTLETHLYRLRGKLREIFNGGELITTYQGSYRLVTADFSG